LQMNVLLVAAKRELVESRVGLLGEAGLAPSVIDVDAFAIHNAFELNHPDAMRGVVGLVNIGHEVTNVNILEDGVPVLTRDLSVGTRRFREDLQREKGLSAEESEKVIQGQQQHADLAGYVESRGEEIAVGVERASAFLATASRSAGQLAIAALDQRLEAVQAGKRRFELMIGQKRQMEMARDSPLAEITVIRRIDEDRYVWPHLLHQVTKALPPYTWLTGIATIGIVP